MAASSGKGIEIEKERRAFAVSALGRGRWYWVVWPLTAQKRAAETITHLAEGFAPSKLEAIDHALAVAGEDAQWLAAGDARRYYTGRAQVNSTSAMIQQEFLYYDMRVALACGQKQWRSLPYLILKCTPKFVYVAAAPYQAAELVAHWPDWHAESSQVKSIRLDRASLDACGYAFVSCGDAERFGLDEPLFYTTPYGARVGETFGQEDCFARLELTPPYNLEAVKRAYRRLAKQHHPDRGGAAARFLALQMAYRQALDALGG